MNTTCCQEHPDHSFGFCLFGCFFPWEYLLSPSLALQRVFTFHSGVKIFATWRLVVSVRVMPIFLIPITTVFQDHARESMLEQVVSCIAAKAVIGCKLAVHHQGVAVEHRYQLGFVALGHRMAHSNSHVMTLGSVTKRVGVMMRVGHTTAQNQTDASAMC
jgi:hypothetical protein